MLVTGHTGFKGSWLALWLSELGADVTGYSLPPPTTPSLFESARVADRIRHRVGDVRDRAGLEAIWQDCRPELVFHLAAESLLCRARSDPLRTLETNILGTANVLEVARRSGEPLALVIVTSDKCYENRETGLSYREDDPLGGRDIYSASKAAAEIVVRSYRESFFPPADLARHGVAVATVRAGNVVGGGDWAPARLVPDCIRALVRGCPVRIRRPGAVRPWQHVLEPLSGYLLLGSLLLPGSQNGRARFASAWNFAPEPENARPVREVVEEVFRLWGSGSWLPADGAHEVGPEADLLCLSSDKARRWLGWKPRWDFVTMLDHTVSWYRAFCEGADMQAWCLRQIRDYLET